MIDIQQKSYERIILAGVMLPPETEESYSQSLKEMERLSQTLGGVVLEQIIQRRHTPDLSTFMGSGKLEEVKTALCDHKATLVAFDNELSGNQQKNLERQLDCRVVDRTGIILDIFSQHARTKEAKLQVELATLEYLSTRLTKMWSHLHRQKGGIGLRGLGEKQLELDRRIVRDRMSRLKKELKKIDVIRANQRRHRDRFLRVALVGYTNAGKSTLMNGLTIGEVLVDDRLFATLDSTVRVIDPKTRPPILLSDTVGFIKKLPHSLVASFRSTLAEVLEADVLLHVVDASSSTWEDQMNVTETVLNEIGAGGKPSFLVFNKVDLVDDFFLPKILAKRYIDSCVVSALSEKDMFRLRTAIYSHFEKDMLELKVLIPYDNSWLQSQVFEHSKVLDKKYLDEGTYLKVRIMRQDANWLKLATHSVE